MSGYPIRNIVHKLTSAQYNQPQDLNLESFLLSLKKPLLMGLLGLFYQGF
jgi:hypothetical protein